MGAALPTHRSPTTPSPCPGQAPADAPTQGLPGRTLAGGLSESTNSPLPRTTPRSPGACWPLPPFSEDGAVHWVYTAAPAADSPALDLQCRVFLNNTAPAAPWHSQATARQNGRDQKPPVGLLSVNRAGHMARRWAATSRASGPQSQRQSRDPQGWPCQQEARWPPQPWRPPCRGWQPQGPEAELVFGPRGGWGGGLQRSSAVGSGPGSHGPCCHRPAGRKGRA